MNKILFIAGIALVFASALVMIGSIAIQSAEASGSGCPNKSGTAAPGVNPNVPNSLNTQSPSQSAAGQTV
jgi:hypothetical protein